jgi:hypothetical protein
MISRAAAAASSKRKAASITRADRQPIKPENVVANLPASQVANRNARGKP